MRQAMSIISSMLLAMMFIACSHNTGGPCAAGTVHCAGLVPQSCVAGRLHDVPACAMTCTEGIGCDDGPCIEGTVRCNGLVPQSCVAGKFHDGATCATVCAPRIGCATCLPGTGTCTGDHAHYCDQAGGGFIDDTCDPLQGIACDPSSGQCKGACTSESLGASYIGCEYYPTVTGNAVGTVFDFAIAVANASNAVATVTIEGGALAAPMTLMVPANAVKVQILPWQLDLKLCSAQIPDGCSTPAAGGLIAKGAYHVRSTNPVTVYQFNSLEFMTIKDNTLYDSFSNDASLLLPTNVWRARYYAAAWGALLEGSSGNYPSELAVTARADATTVTINSKAASIAAPGAPAFSINTPQSILLNAGDVLEITSLTGDFTGSLVTSDKPIQVVSGHYCTLVPAGVSSCDHLEESMFSVDALGEKYMINAPAVTSLPMGKVEIVRIIGTQAGTTLTYDPPQPGAPTLIANAGDFVEVPSSASSYMLTASAKVLVAQYMEGETAGGMTGDPSMALAVPVEQFRSTYLFHSPLTYDTNFVDVTAPMGAVVMLDGAPVTLQAVAGTGYGLARVTPLGAGPNADGNHNIVGTMPFGISVYGYGQYTSYWYPGGLNVTDLIF